MTGSIERRIKLTVRLQEDAHIGLGTGWLDLIDDRHARDRSGRPVLWSSAVHNLLRDAADDLNQHGHRLARRDRIQRLFGSEGPTERRAELVCSSWHFDGKKRESRFIESTSTAREANSRRPLESTLRTLEMSTAGQTAGGELRFLGDDDDVAFMTLCLKRVTHVGGRKTRGFGQVWVKEISDALVAEPAAPIDKPGPGRLRLLLRLVEPVCVPKTGYPGNVIETEDFLPGRILRAAWLEAARRAGLGDNERTLLANPDHARFADALCVHLGNVNPANLDLARLDVIPLPLSAVQLKETEQAHSSTLPWWASRTAQNEWPTNGRDRDTLLSMVDDSRYRRIKQSEVLCSLDGATYRRARATTTVLMRNRTPNRRAGRPQFDSRRSDGKSAENEPRDTKGELFAQTVIAEEERFLAEIRVETEVAANAINKLSSFFGTHPGWLRLGRGGRPAEVLRFAWIPDSSLDANAVQLEGNSFTLTLTSDLIAVDNDLTYATRLSGPLLATLAGIAAKHANAVCITRAIEDSTDVHGFNSAAGTRRAPVPAIRRGSAYVVASEDSDVLASLYQSLRELESHGRGIGERVEEGCGRFFVDHRAHSLNASETPQNTLPEYREPEPKSDEAIRSAAIAAFAKIHKDLGSVDNAKRFPARGQWQYIRHRLESDAAGPDTLRGLHEEVSNHARLKSGAMWKEIWPKVWKAALKSFPSTVPIAENPAPRTLHNPPAARQGPPPAANDSMTLAHNHAAIRKFLIYLTTLIVRRFEHESPSPRESALEALPTHV